MQKQEGEKMDEAPKGNKSDVKLVVLTAAVVLLALVGAAYYMGYFGGQPQQPAKPATGQEATRIFLLAMDKESQLGGAHLQYTDFENGFSTRYELRTAQNSSWVAETGDYGSLEAFFGQNNSTDAICLTYLNKTKCANVGESESVAQIASRLKTRLPSVEAAVANKRLVERLIGAGAIKFSDDIASERLGSFETKRVVYNLDYRNLTVQTLISIGISPNDPTIYSITNWTVTNWIDERSGRLVKSETWYSQNGAPYSFSRVFSVLEEPGGDIPAAPQTMLSASAFSAFYQSAEEDYMKKRACLNGPVGEKSTCLKSLAVENGDPSACDLIADVREAGLCFLVVAQTTKNATLCQKAGSLVDDCYIAVASETGDGELCKKLENSSLIANCYEAKLVGELAAAEKKAEKERLLAGRNCEDDSGCYVAGGMGQYCAPSANKGPFANETALQFACLKGVPCGCVDGYCRFKTFENENYTSCMEEVEDKLTEDFIRKIAQDAEAARKAANQTNNSTAAG